jgi:hypothetical protein
MPISEGVTLPPKKISCFWTGGKSVDPGYPLRGGHQLIKGAEQLQRGSDIAPLAIHQKCHNNGDGIRVQLSRGDIIKFKEFGEQRGEGERKTKLKVHPRDASDTIQILSFGQ